MVEWISHRGIRDDARFGVCSENSYKAFALARDAGFTGLETDVRCTADGQLVLSHDHDLRRCFGKNLIVETSASSDLRTLVDPYGDKLLFFDEFVETFADLNWVLDIKPESALRVVKIFSEGHYRSLLQSRLARTRFLFWGLAPQVQLISDFPGADCFARQGECWRAGLATLMGLPLFGHITPGKTYSLPPDLHGISLYRKALFAAYHRKGAKVLAYLPETKDQVRLAIEAGADLVLANSALFAK